MVFGNRDVRGNRYAAPDVTAPRSQNSGRVLDSHQADHHATLQSVVESFDGHGATPALVTIGDEAIEVRYFSTVAQEVRSLASGLLATGVEQGEPVGLYAENNADWIIAFLATVIAGAVAVPFDITLRGQALAEPFRDSGCRRCFVTPQQAAALQEIGVADATTLYLLGRGACDGTTVSWRELTAGDPMSLPVLSGDDQAALFYTSGTTGTPKGVPLTHANLTANINALVTERMVKPGDRTMLPLPLHHVYPLVVGALAPLASGAGVVFPAGISGPQIVDALHRGDISVLIGVPRLYSSLLEAIEARIREQGRLVVAVMRLVSWLLSLLPGRLDRSLRRIAFRPIRQALGPRLQLLASGGAKLDPEIWRSLEGFGWTVLTGYGLTETAPILTFNPHGKAKIGSAGKALANVELRISQPSEMGIGEIEARGPNIFSGYRNRPEETEKVFAPDGWFRTGDLGHLDNDGYLYIAGRAKELIVLPDGKNVFPETVEAVYSASPFIGEIAVLEKDGSLVGLVVPDLDALRKRGAESAVQLIYDEIRDLSPLLAPYQRLSSHVLTRTTLPRTAIGKLKRHQLADIYRNATADTPQLADALSVADRRYLSEPDIREIWDWLKQRFPDQPLSLEASPQLDLGVDSLGWVGLSLEIENRFKISLSEDQIAHIVTLRDLIHEISQAAAAPLPSRNLPPELEQYLTEPGLLRRFLGALIYTVLRVALRLFFRLKVQGLHNLPRDGAFIIAPNHTSWLDPIAVAASLPYARIKTTHFAGWTGLLFDSIVSRAFSRVARVLPVNPDRATAGSLGLARAVLNRDCVLVWFPEGRRSRTGELLAFQPGIGALVRNTAVPIVPTFISGTFAAAPSGHPVPRLKRIEVRFGAPHDADLLERSDDADTGEQRIANGLRTAVLELQKAAAAGSSGSD